MERVVSFLKESILNLIENIRILEDKRDRQRQDINDFVKKDEYTDEECYVFYKNYYTNLGADEELFGLVNKIWGYYDVIISNELKVDFEDNVKSYLDDLYQKFIPKYFLDNGGITPVSGITDEVFIESMKQNEDFLKKVIYPTLVEYKTVKYIEENGVSSNEE